MTRVIGRNNLISRVWDIHNGECLRTVALAGSPPLTQGRFTCTADVGLFGSLNGKITMFNVTTGRVIREYSGHANSDYILDLGFRYSNGDITGFLSGSEDGRLHLFDFDSPLPQESITLCSDKPTIDLLVSEHGNVFASGRSLNTLYQIKLKEDRKSGA